MSFMDDLKRSLGFEETESGNSKREGPSIIDSLRDVLQPKGNPNGPQNNHQQQYRPNPQPQYRANPKHTQAPNPPQPQPVPVEEYDDWDDVIIPEQTYYEIILIRPKTIDDINYVVDQVTVEKNPVILDLSFLEKESAPNYKLAGDKIKQMRSRYGAEALLLSRTEDKNLIIIAPNKVKVINKG